MLFFDYSHKMLGFHDFEGDQNLKPIHQNFAGMRSAGIGDDTPKIKSGQWNFYIQLRFREFQMYKLYYRFKDNGIN